MYPRIVLRFFLVPYLAAVLACPHSFASEKTRAKKVAMVNVYHIPFGVTLCEQHTKKDIANEYNRVAFAPDEQSDLYRYLNQRGVKEPFDAKQVHLFVLAQNDHPEYLVDSNGVVQVSGETYLIRPIALVDIERLLSPKI